jgi:hypothetical protein
MDKENKIESVVSKLLIGDIDVECVGAINTISKSTESSDLLVRALVSQQLRTGRESYTVLFEILHLLEQIADHCQAAACIFMAYLWQIASGHVGTHDICDSIDLWLANCRELEVDSHLAHIASTADDESVRRHFRQLMSDRS